MSNSQLSRRGFGAAAAAFALVGSRNVFSQLATPASSFTNGVQQDGSWRFLDDRGRDVHLAKPPTRIVSSIESGAALLDYGIEVLGVVGTFADETGWRDEGAGNLDENGVAYLGEWDNVDLEAILALDADLYVDVTYDASRVGSYSVSEGLADLMEQTVPTLAIAVGGGVSLPQPLARFDELALAITGTPPPAELVEAKEAFAATEKRAREVFAEKSDLIVALVAVGHEPGAMTFWDPREFADVLYYQHLGLNFLSIEPDQGYTLGVSVEQAGMFDYDVMLNRVEPELLLDSLDNYPTVSLVKAVEARQIYKWSTVYPPSYRGFLPVLEALVTNISESEKVV